MSDNQENNQTTLIIILKFISGGVLIGSIFYLVIKYNLSPDIYVNFASIALTAIGVHEISKKK